MLAIVLVLLIITIHFPAYNLIEKEQEELNIATISEQKTEGYENQMTLQEKERYKYLENTKTVLKWLSFLFFVSLLCLIYSFAFSIKREFEKIESCLQCNGGELNCGSKCSTYSDILLEEQILEMPNKISKHNRMCKTFRK